MNQICSHILQRVMIVFLIGCHVIDGLLITSNINKFRNSERSTHMATSVSNMGKVEEAELVKIFGRLADKMLLLDVEGAGKNNEYPISSNRASSCPFIVRDPWNEKLLSWRL